MLDELAVEKHVRWDDLHNNFQGTCHKHKHKIPLDFTSERELNILCEAMQNDEVHLATEATVAAIGVLSSDPQEYAVQPILFSGTCKKETSEQHACVIKTVLEACNKQKRRNNATYHMAMTCELSADSPIYALLQPLEFLNLLVGPDDITTDKDFKHIIKRQWNIFMHTKGVKILGFCITPAILCSQLEYNGISTHCLGSLLNPNDKQDVLLAFSLLREIWSLPPPPTNCDPVLRTGTSMSYLDINLMVKNAFFCIAKMKINNPGANFYLVLLGTDQLETFFGLIRTAVGTDANVDMLQLGSRASGLTEVIAILAEHPEWDYGMCHLSLPVFSKETLEFTSKADHIGPKDWRSNLSAEELIPDAEAILSTLSHSHASIDMLSPLGELVVNQRNDNFNETEEVNEEGDAFNTSSRSEGCPRPQAVPYTHEGSEDDEGEGPQHRMENYTSRSSTDRLKRVQQLPCFDPVNRVSDTDIITSGDGTLGTPSLCIGNPIAVIVQCEDLVVLAVAQVNRLKFAGKDNLNELPLHLLADPTAKVDSQILRLVPATLDDDPTQVHDWCWSLQMEVSCNNIPGQGVHPINPSLSVQRLGQPTFLFESTFLVTLSCNLFQELRPQERRNLRSSNNLNIFHIETQEGPASSVKPYYSKKKRNAPIKACLAVSEAHLSRLFVSSTQGSTAVATHDTDDLDKEDEDADTYSDLGRERDDSDDDDGWDLYHKSTTPPPPSSPLSGIPSSSTTLDPTSAMITTPTMAFACTGAPPANATAQRPPHSQALRLKSPVPSGPAH
ncbi:hypothetical protein EI94DRAFT_1798606 [Lactarius quietus]|nr:hypothetical protein EI94DRAFT_1798606 [Lactarius quietus]